MNESSLHDQLASVAARLDARREAILDRWRSAIEADAAMTASSALTRQEFYDHIPTLLKDFTDILRHSPDCENSGENSHPAQDARDHGLDRWHQGYRLPEVLGEWRHLHLCMVDELERIARKPAGVERALPIARRKLAELCNEGVCASAVQYTRLQQAEAEGRVADLERAVSQFEKLESERAGLWHEAAHDLRGSLGAVRSATAVLSSPATVEWRTRSIQVVERGVEAMLGMLNGLLSLARLEAGREVRELSRCDVAAALSQLAESLQPRAAERKLYLRCTGPESLEVEGDVGKICRIAQNLLLNALNYTRHGGVSLEWETREGGDVAKWVLRVQDTGPGFPLESAAPIVEALETATELSHERSGEPIAELLEREPDAQASAEDAPGETGDSAASVEAEGVGSGEGIGLSIVKRLCELLDATLEADSAPDRGSSFEVIFPQKYPANPQTQGC